MKIALISCPWQLFNRPSIQLASLKAFLNERLPKLKVDLYHFYLNIANCLGYELYRKISETVWLSEPIYGALLYPEKKDEVKRFWERNSRKILKEKISFEKICGLIKEESERLIDSIDWRKYILVGFSICFSQLTSSLYFIRQIKKRADVKIVVGGSSCSGDLGESLLDVYDEIDYVIQGEGELPLYHLVLSLIDGKKIEFPGILSRESSSKGISQIQDLDELPIPDYSDYFEQIKHVRPFYPKLLMEMSRGCWWRRCAFCNLNLQWKGYRRKSAERIKKELKELVERYQILSVSFTDNLIPKAKEIFSEIKGLKKDLQLFAEIRADTPLDLLILMERAGVKEVQVGIEALSTSLLRKMRKGVTAIENIEIMKNCEAKGTPNLTGNLILQFPGSDEKDVEETLKNMEFVFYFRPLKGIPFWLGYKSYVWRNPRLFGIKNITLHPNYRHVFPENILRRLKLMIQGYHGDMKKQKRIWKPVKEKIKKWESFYKKLHKDGEPILSYQDGGDFLIIRQKKEDMNMIHKLRGVSRMIYLFCQKHRSISEIIERFKIDEVKLLPFLRMMEEKRLMFSEKEKFLSLAVPSKGY